MNADVYTQQTGRRTHSAAMKDVLITCSGRNMKSWKNVSTQIFWKQIRTVEFGKKTPRQVLKVFPESWKTLLNIWMENIQFFYRIKKIFNHFLKLWLCFLFRRPIITMCWETDVEDSDSLSDCRNVLTPQSIVEIIKWGVFFVHDIIWCLKFVYSVCWVSVYLVLFCFSVFEIRGSALCPQLPHRSPFTLSSVSFLLNLSLFL